jgi:hypothetical protein
MIDIENIAQRHQDFLDTVANKQLVFTLKNDEGYALAEAQEFLDEEDMPLELMCLWSEESMAKELLIEDWKDYEITTIALPEFLEKWCIGLAAGNMIIGTNFDKQLFGYELHPLELAMELLNKLKSQNIELNFSRFESVSDFIRAIEATVG